MGIALMFLLALYQMQSAIHSEIIEAPGYKDNTLLETSEGLLHPESSARADSEIWDGLLNDGPEQTELEFRYPISAIGIDYAKNSVVLRFQKHARKQRYRLNPDFELKRKSMQDNFMHFGKRQAEQLPKATGPGYFESVKRAAMDRYGRDPKQDFMRFGRDPKEDFMRFGRNPEQDFMRFGRDPKQDFMRFGRSDNFMRFGRNVHPHEELRSPKQDFMRFGRPDNFMRFGRAVPTEFERYGKMDANFMRFGKSIQAAGVAQESNQTKSVEEKQQQQQQQQSSDPSNPVDKTLNILFNKQRQGIQDEPEQPEPQKLSDDSSSEQFYEP